MTKREIAKLLTLIKSVYPNYNKDLPVGEVALVVEFWYSLLCDYDNRVVTVALQAYAVKDTKGFAPVPGQLLAEIRQIMGHVKQERYLTHMEAWERVREVMSDADCYYNPDKVFQSLPEYIKQVIGSVGTLVKWSGMDIERLETVIMPNFRDSYKGIVEDRKNWSMLPSNVISLIENLSVKPIEGNNLVIPFKRLNGSEISKKVASNE